MFGALLAFAGLMSHPIAQGRATVVSPEVQKDHRVTFRLRMTNARQVTVLLEGIDTHFEMQKDSDGVWTTTTSILPPEIYGYFFVVDGAAISDPANPEKAVGATPESFVLVPADPPALWETQDVPHGVVHHHVYLSKAIGGETEYLVYTPPHYGRGAAFPVLYLLHGNGGTAEAWVETGPAATILDNLFAKRMAKDMVVVMPRGYGIPSGLTIRGLDNSDPELRRRSYDGFRDALLSEVIPQVETQYKVSRRAADRAIAGLSMGGRETLQIALNDATKFAYIGAFSSGSFSDDFDADFPRLKAGEINLNAKLLMVSCGSEDHLVETNRKLKAWLRAKGVRFEDVVTPGKHEWPVWRNNLIHFCQELFR